MSRTLSSKTLLLPLLLTPLGAAIAAPAAAAGVEVTPTVSYRSDGYDLSPQPLVCVAIFRDCQLVAEADDGPAFGVVVGFDLRPGWQLEVLASRRDSDLQVLSTAVPINDPPTPIERRSESDLTVTHLQAGLARTWGEGTVRPFGGVAAGVSRLETDAAGPISEDAFSASAGAGVKVDLSNRLGLRLEGRGWWVDLPEHAGGDFTQLDATAGLILRF